MCWAGEPGSEGHSMNIKEVIASLARLSLTGKLSLAMSECAPLYGFVPYYEWNPEITIGELVSQISVQSFGARYGTLQERELSIVLKIL